MFLYAGSPSAYIRFLSRPVWVGLLIAAGVTMDYQLLSDTPAPELFISYLALVFGLSAVFYGVEWYQSRGGKAPVEAAPALTQAPDEERKAA